MTEVIILPPSPEPKKVTAYLRPRNLQEQLMAFLNSNNPNGFVEDAKYKDEPLPFEYREDARKIVDILIEISNRYLLTTERLKSYGREIKKVSGRRNIRGKDAHKLNIQRFAIPQKESYNVAAIVLGYSSFQDAINNAVVGNGGKMIIYNKRQPGEFKAEFFPDIE